MLKRTIGRSVTVVFLLLLLIAVASAQGPQRIVSLAPSITEILFALGLGDRVVGVTSFCDRPPEALKKTKVGGMTNPSLEKVLRLKPDIVVLTVDGNPKEFEERLKKLRIRTYVFRARKISDLPGAIVSLGEALGVKSRAIELANRFRTTVDKYRASHLKAKKQKALFIIWPEPLIVAGPGTAIDEAMALVGLENIAKDAKARYPRYCLEEVIRADPDIIFIGKGHVDMRKVSGRILERLSEVSAVRHGRVFYVSDALYRLGPRLLKGIQELADALK